ncbi:Hypothetical protein SMAX5B_008321 [Scophthalmus maximus]|uniref:Uncharacterized protein n=1 Tax=Scophthalmus maximus TaxID=52904 RepID=A0A2U9CZB4_SCOMX|nr:Hypothetical protein SMAX5B_008321 [Scophthalmus maximus]
MLWIHTHKTPWTRLPQDHTQRHLGRPAESVDVHGVLLLSLLHRGQSLHRTSQGSRDQQLVGAIRLHNTTVMAEPQIPR